MIFIKKAVSLQQASMSLVDMVDKRLAGWEKARDHSVIHISDLSRDTGFCPREFALLSTVKKEAKGHYVSTALRVAFDNGNALSDLCRNKWLVDDVVGNWQCLYCKNTVEFSKRPKTECKTKGCGARLWQYREIEVVNPHNGASGSIDFFIDFGQGKHTAVECKTMSKDIFNDLKAPLAEHRIRTQLYLLHLSKWESPHAAKIDTSQGLVFYISKGFGAKGVVGNKVMPIREYWVPRDDAAVEHLYKRADAVAAFKKGGVMPAGICATSAHKRVSSCSVPKECWSGSYPAGV